ncbi:MAG: hypothetical protein HOB20_13425 [Planctomycetaceae bacterium]|nr:hypothetical protein [Planctomycetaceae bacterium]
MTLIGKIFTVLIFIMSFLFMGFSITVYQTHIDLQVAAKTVEDRNTNLESLRTTLENEKESVEDSLKRERIARAYALAALETQVEAVAADLADKEEIVKTTQARSNDLSDALRIAEATKKQLTTEVQGLRTDINDAQLRTDTFFAQILTLTDEVNHLKSLETQAQERESQLRNQIGRLSNVVQRNGLDEFTDVLDKPPALDGRVIAIQKDLLQISLGKDDGLRIGHRLDVYRGALYLGRVQIRETQPSSAVCEIIPESQKGQIRKDDNVITNLN